MNLTIIDHPSSVAGANNGYGIVGGEFYPTGPEGSTTAVKFVPVDNGQSLLLAEVEGRWAVLSSRHRDNDCVWISATDLDGTVTTKSFPANPGVIEFGYVTVKIDTGRARAARPID